MSDNNSSPTGTAQDPEDRTAQRLRYGLSLAGRDVRAPAGIATAALHGGRRRRRHRRVVLAAPIALVAVGAAGLGWQQPWVASTRTVPAAPSQLAEPTSPSSSSASSAAVEGQVEVPNVVGMSMSEATARLTAAGFGVRVPSAQVASPSVAAGLVATQSSYAAAPGALITISASSGPPTLFTNSAYEIPNLPNAHPMQPGGQTIEGASGRLESPLAGPIGCAQGSPDPLSIAGRQMQWVEDTNSQGVVTLIVTGWLNGTAAAIFDAATSGSLACRVTGQLTPLDVPVAGADQSWAVTADLGAGAEIAGAARVGDLIVGASLRAATTQAATSRAGELSGLLTAAVQDLRESGLPAAQAHGLTG